MSVAYPGYGLCLVDYLCLCTIQESSSCDIVLEHTYVEPSSIEISMVFTMLAEYRQNLIPFSDNLHYPYSVNRIVP